MRNLSEEEDDELVCEVGRRIRATRRAAGLTLAQLADICGLSAAVVASYERGDRTPNVRSLTKIGRALRVPPSSLLPVTIGDGVESEAWVRQTHALATEIAITTQELLRLLVPLVEGRD